MLDQPVHECSECPLNSNGRCPFVTRKLSAGSSVWGQGDVPREVIFVKDGLLSISSSDATGHEVMSAVRGPRTLLGFEALRIQPSRGAVDAITDATVCTADASLVRQWAGLDGAANQQRENTATLNFCTQCGRPLGQRDAFCRQCGAEAPARRRS